MTKAPVLHLWWQSPLGFGCCAPMILCSDGVSIMAKGNNSGRFRKKMGFAAVSNAVAMDSRLSLKAKGLYLLIQTYITIPGFTLYKNYLMSQCKEGDSAFDSAWNELKRNGYLQQYKLKNPETKQFYYEYELYDEPIDNTEASIEPHPENQGMAKPDPDFPGMAFPDVGNPPHGFSRRGKQGVYNHTIPNQTIPSHTIPNHILSATRQQIGYADLDIVHNGIDMTLVDEIVNLMSEVYGLDRIDKIRVQKRDIEAGYVQERLHLLNQNHIAYVVDKVLSNTTKVKNPKAYLLTMLYNAPVTMETDVQFSVSHDINSRQFF
jgi:hypothetical protein